MTEREWLQATDPQPMLYYLRDKASDRKLRLFAVACVRRVWHLLAEQAGRSVVERVESHVDGRGRRPSIAVGGTGPDPRETAEKAARFTATPVTIAAAFGAASEAADAVAAEVIQASEAGRERVVPDAVLVAANAAGVTEEARQADLLRCIFGNPFCPITIHPAWLTWHDGLLVSMAQRMYDSRDFTDMPVLADALEEAGCANPDVLSHCRQQGAVHARGCWVADLLLNKA